MDKSDKSKDRDKSKESKESKDRAPEDDKTWRGKPTQLSGSGYPYYDDVQRAHQELKDEGKIFPTSEHDCEQHKGLLTRRAGYYSNLHDKTIGILEKTTGNNSEGYSVDIVIRKIEAATGPEGQAQHGVFWDVATSEESGGMHTAKPVNGGPSGPDPALADRWRQPTAELAGLTEGGGQPEPEPGPGPTPPTPGGSLLDRDIRPFDVAYSTFVSDASEFDRLGREWYKAWSGREPALSDLHHGYWRCMLEREQWVTPRKAFNDAWPLPPDQQPQ